MSNRYELGDTWIDPEELAYNTYSGAPSGSGRRGYVRFPDGKLRVVRLGVPDTYFSIPAKPSHGPIGFVFQDNGEFCFASHGMSIADAKAALAGA